MKIIILTILFILASLSTFKTIFYGIYEIKQKNIFGGICVISFSSLAYLLLSILFLMQ